MNARDSAVYFESIGLELLPSPAKHHRWQLLIPDGHGQVLHFLSLDHLWRFVRLQVLSHFQQEWIAAEIIHVVENQSHPDWREVDKWFHGDISALPEFTYPIWDHVKATRTMISLPYHWRKGYVSLIRPYGSPQYPLFGRALRKGMLELHARKPALCSLPTCGIGHVEYRDSGVDRKAADGRLAAPSHAQCANGDLSTFYCSPVVAANDRAGA